MFNIGTGRVAGCAVQKNFAGVWTRTTPASQIAEVQMSSQFLDVETVLQIFYLDGYCCAFYVHF